MADTQDTGTQDTGTETQESDRDLDTLLKLDTYQGMSDKEINKLIEYAKTNAYTQGYNAATESVSTKQAEQAASDANKAWQNAQAAFTNACAVSPSFKTIASLEVAP